MFQDILGETAILGLNHWSCERGAGRTFRHEMVNEFVKGVLTTCDIPLVNRMAVKVSTEKNRMV